jgi:Fe2+ or Zn2+ uptake regulation protein/O6-methylguanine-DNA--protein-cysteine methyltransferase
VTPQRRAILGAFTGAPTEHLSADEIHAKASSAVPELSRGTVYATLAELTELGMLAAFGSAEPVRYEVNSADHQHFRCRLCLRLYDIALPAVRTDRVRSLGFVVERTAVTVEGVCAECVDYDTGLREGTRSVQEGATSSALPAGLARAEMDSPVGPLHLAATTAGLVRLVFDDHADASALRELPRRRTGSNAARGHIAAAQAYVDAYFTGSPAPSACVVDWAAVDNISAPTLQAVQTIPFGVDRSYEALRTDADAHTRGLALGTNPLALVVPCHRVTRGRDIPGVYVGGTDRKRALRLHER